MNEQDAKAVFDCCDLHRAIADADCSALTRLLKRRWMWSSPPQELLAHSNNEGNTPLLCLLGGNPGWGSQCFPAPIACFPMRLLTLLLDRGSDPNKGNHDERNAFHEAAGYCCYVRREGADLDMKWENPRDYSPQWRSFIFDHLRRRYGEVAPGSAVVLEILVQAGADINRLDRKKQNALHYACRKHSNPSVIRCLLQLGVDPLVKDWQGNLPESLATRPEVGDLISRHRKPAA